MGYASYFEDIQEAHIETAPATSKAQSSGGRASARLPFQERRRRDLLSGYQLLVGTIAELRRVNGALLTRVRDLERGATEINRLHDNNVGLRKRLRNVEVELERERGRRKAAELGLKELERRLLHAPDGMERLIDAYSNPGDIDFFKPGERRDKG